MLETYLYLALILVIVLIVVRMVAHHSPHSLFCKIGWHTHPTNINLVGNRLVGKCPHCGTPLSKLIYEEHEWHEIK
jgi:hypothetical protein